MSLAAPALIAAAAGVGFGHAVLPDHWMPLAVLARTQRYSLRRVLRLSALAGSAHVGFSLLLGAVVIAVGLQFRSVVEHRENLIVGGLLTLTGAVFLVLELAGRGHGHSHDEHGGHSHSHSHSHSHGHGHGHRDHDHPHDDLDHAHDDHLHDDHNHLVGDHDHPHNDHSHPVGDHDHSVGDHSDAHDDHDQSVGDRDHGHDHDHSHHARPKDHAERSRAARLLAFAVPFGAAASPDLTILPVFLAASALGVSAAVGTLIAFSMVTAATIVGLTLLGTVAGYQLRGAWVDRGANLITAAVLLIIGVLVGTGTI